MRKHSVQKIMKKTAAYTVLLSCLTTNILVAPMTAYAGQATADVDETLYLNLDYYGNVSDANVVKGINFNGTSSYTDFGDYLMSRSRRSRTVPSPSRKTRTESSSSRAS